MEEIETATDKLIAEIDPDGPDAYLRNALREFRLAAENVCQPADARNAGRALSRFCTEHLDWETELYRKCMSLVALTRDR